MSLPEPWAGIDADAVRVSRPKPWAESRDSATLSITAPSSGSGVQVGTLGGFLEEVHDVLRRAEQHLEPTELAGFAAALKGLAAGLEEKNRSSNRMVAPDRGFGPSFG